MIIMYIPKFFSIWATISHSSASGMSIFAGLETGLTLLEGGMVGFNLRRLCKMLTYEKEGEIP